MKTSLVSSYIVSTFVAVCSIAFLLTGCSQPAAVTKPQQRLSYSIIPADPTNPFDSLAQLHAQALDNFIQRVGPLAGSLSNQAIADTVYGWLQDSGISVSNYSHYRSFCDSVLNNNETTYQVIDDYTTLGFFTSTQKTYLYRIQGIEDSLQNSTLDSAGFVNAIKTVENDIISNITDTTRNTPLCMAAIARGSYYYWHNQALLPVSPWPASYFRASYKKQDIPLNRGTNNMHSLVDSPSTKDAKGAVKAVGEYSLCGIISFAFGGPIGTASECVIAMCVGAIIASAS